MLNNINQLHPVTPRDLNTLIGNINDANEITGVPPVEVTREGGQVQIRYAPKGFLAAITHVEDLDGCGSSSSSSSGSLPHYRWKYTVQEVYQLDNGLWAFADDGRIVTAWEYNDNIVDENTIVAVEPVGDDDYRFKHCCSGLPPVCSSSSSSSSSSSDSSSSSSSSSSSRSSSSSSSSQSSSSSSSGSCHPDNCFAVDTPTGTVYLSIFDGKLYVNCCSSSSSSSSSQGEQLPGGLPEFVKRNVRNTGGCNCGNKGKRQI